MLSVKNLTFSYGPQPVLNIPSLTLKNGENLLVRGTSGSGKTSLLFLLAGFLTPTSGTVVVEGTDLATLRESKKDAFRGQTFGFIFQQPHLLAPLTALQNVMVAGSMAGHAPNPARAKTLLERLGLADRLHHRPHQLSQGQMQRVAIARALLGHPKVVLADEPTSALDDTATQNVIALLQDVSAEEGAQLVVTSHDARIAPYFGKTLNLNAPASQKGN